MAYTKKSERYFLLFSVALFLILTFIVINEIFAVIIYSAILSYFLYPLYNYYLSKTESKEISAILTLVTATIGIFIPLIFLSYFMVLNLLKLIVEYREYIENPELLNGFVSEAILKLTGSPELSSFDFSVLFTQTVKFAIGIAESFFTSIPMMIFNFFIILFISYYILIHNKDIFKAMNQYIPLGLVRQNQIIRNIARNIQVLFRGYFLTGIIQTLVAIFGYLIFGVPNLLIISFLTLLVSLIPYLGTPLVWVPVAFYMIIVGETHTAGIGLLIYGTLIISTVDNFLRPVLMSNKNTIAPPLVFIGFIGGMFAFGLQGLILGPVIISITAILLKYLTEASEVK